MGYLISVKIVSRLRERQARRKRRDGVRGAGRVLVAAYAILALAALGRSTVQILGSFATAPLAYTLSAVSAVIYLVATIALAQGERARTLAWGAVVIEFVGVVTVGLISSLAPELFPKDTVWSHFGQGYGYVPAILPVLGMAWLESSKHAPSHGSQGAATS